MGTRVTVAVVGYGLAGRVFHAPLVAATPGLEVAAIVTTDAGRRAQAATDHPGARIVGDVAEVLRGPDPVGLVVVATANAAHVQVAHAAVEAGTAVVVDKPLAPTAAGARALVAAAAAAAVPLGVFHQRRWDADVLTLRALLDAGELGAVHRFESRFERWRPAVREGAWREDPDPAAGGGLLADLGSHLVDQALWLWGPAAQVYAEVDTRRRGARVDDDVFVAIRHAGGVRSHLWAGALVGDRGPHLRVLGDRAGWAIEGLDAQEDRLRAGGRPGDPGWGAHPGGGGRLSAGDEHRDVPAVPGAWGAFYAQVAAAVAGEAAMPVTGAEALAVLDVLDAARRSAATGTVVELDPGPPGS